MNNYIDAFVFHLERDNVATYKEAAQAVARIYREYGAIGYYEYVGDDLDREGTLPFPKLMGTSTDQVIVFGWIVYESRESRNLVNQKIESDPRMMELVGPLLNPNRPVFDPAKMAFGGFSPMIHEADS